LCSIVFVLTTATGLRKPLSFSSLSGYTRDALWTSFSGIFVVVAVVLLGYGGKKTWQVRALITGGAVGVVLAACLVWFEDIRKAVQSSDGRPVAAVVLAVATIGLLGVAVFRNLNSKSEVRKQLGRVFLLVTSVYLLVSLILWQCMENSALQTAESSTRSKLLWAVLIVAGLILLSCLGIVALVQIRERLRLRKNAQVLEWCKQELEVSVEAERRLAAAQTQWSATGAVD
jgi:succinate dehydrogenase hydrophobic anchor subunit